MLNLLYPQHLEAWWSNEAMRITGAPDPRAALERLEQQASRLSDLFTTERAPGFGEYIRHPSMLVTYGLFFFPQTYVRTLLVVDEVLGRGGWAPPTGRPIQIADLGSGTGAASLALLARLPPGPAHVTALDAEPEALHTLSRLAADPTVARPGLTVSTRVGHLLHDVERLPDVLDVIVCSFALNELTEIGEDVLTAWRERLLQRLAPGGLLLLIEPAQEKNAQRFERWRDDLAQRDSVDLVAPCLHRGPCPLRAAGTAWCHEVRHWAVPTTVRQLNRHLFRRVQFLKYCFLALARREPAPAHGAATRARLVAPVELPKGRFGLRGCAADGLLHRYEVLNRSLTAEERVELRRVERGDVVKFDSLEERPGDLLRASRAEVERGG